MASRTSLRLNWRHSPHPVKVTDLHPATVKRYLAGVEDLAGTLTRRAVAGDEDVASALRELIAAVIVHAAEKDEPRVEVPTQAEPIWFRVGSRKNSQIVRNLP